MDYETTPSMSFWASRRRIDGPQPSSWGGQSQAVGFDPLRM